MEKTSNSNDSAIALNITAESITEAENCTPEVSAENSLQPIYSPEPEEDVEMEEFLKFKSEEKSVQREDIEKVKDPNDEEKNIEEGTKNFFNQYRESINLLYDENS